MRVVLVDPRTTGHHLEYVSFLGRFMAEQGDEVTFVTYQRPGDLCQLVGLPVRVESAVVDSSARRNRNAVGRFWASWATSRRAWEITSALDADVVHHVYVDRNELALARLVRHARSGARGGPSVFGTLFWPYYDGTGNNGWANRIYHAGNVSALRQAMTQKSFHALFVHDDHIRRALVGRLGTEQLHKKVVVIPDPVETHPFEIGRDEARARLGLPTGLPLFLFFGGMRHDKGPDVALAALEYLDAEYGLVLAGEPGLISEDDARVAEDRLRGAKAKLYPRLGWIADAEARLYFAAADCILLPYRDLYSGTSGVLQRAAAAGRPVIASDVQVVGRIVKENKLGLTVPAGSIVGLAKGMATFLGLSTLERNEMERAAGQYAVRYDWRVMAQLVRNRYVASLGDVS